MSSAGCIIFLRSFLYLPCMEIMCLFFMTRLRAVFLKVLSIFLKMLRTFRKTARNRVIKNRHIISMQGRYRKDLRKIIQPAELIYKWKEQALLNQVYLVYEQEHRLLNILQSFNNIPVPPSY